MKRVLCLAVCLIMAATAAGCAKTGAKVEPKGQLVGTGDMTPAPCLADGDAPAQMKLPEDGETVAVLRTDFGDIAVRFFPEQAPKAVENFLIHAQNGYYNGVLFHRVVSQFMIQGGDPEGNGTGGESIWGKYFEDEFSGELHNLRGALSMANRGTNTNGSQFFVVQAQTTGASYIKSMYSAAASRGYTKEVIGAYKTYGGTPHLDYNHTVFGQVFAGMDTVDKIAAVSTDSRSNKPLQDVVIRSVDVLEYKSAG